MKPNSTEKTSSQSEWASFRIWENATNIHQMSKPDLWHLYENAQQLVNFSRERCPKSMSSMHTLRTVYNILRSISILCELVCSGYSKQELFLKTERKRAP